MTRLRTFGKLAASMGVGALCFAVVAHMTAGPPVKILSISENDGVAVRGGRLELDVKRVNSRLCDVHTDRDLWRWEDRKDAAGNKIRIRVVVPLEIPSAVIVPDNETHFIVSLDVPGNISTGQWLYTARSKYECTWLPSFFAGDVLQTPDVPVRIEEPGQSSRPAVLTIIPETKP